MNGADETPLSTPHRVVRASAGSGKTHRLALRYLEILFAGGRPETMVAATFTREAAGEILSRVLVRLAGAAADPAEASRLGAELGRGDLGRARAEQALRSVCESLDRAMVSTLDSFFFRLIVALRFELGLGGLPAMAALDDPLYGGLLEQSVEATLESFAARDWDELVELYERLHGSAARRSVARSLEWLLRDLYEVYLEAPAVELWGGLAAAPPPVPGALRAAGDELEAALRASAPGALRRALAADLELLRRGEWQRLLERGLAGKVAAAPLDDAPSYGRTSIPPVWVRALRVVVAEARHRVVAAQIERTRATHRLLDAFHRHSWELRRRRGVLFFGDLAAGLRRWLPERRGELLDELYYRIDGRVGHLLLDEFQDTSLAQWSVLRPIAEEIRSWGDGSRTFYCVGDPKQAIYGWRGGCADLFDQIEEDLGLEPGSGERLEESWRSSQLVLDAVNAVIGGLPRVESLVEHGETVARWSAAFGPHRARRDLAGYVELVESPAEESHLAWGARRIAALRASMPEASIAVLVQTNDQATAMLDGLRQAGVEASGEGGGAVADDPAVATVMAALRLADHPGDTAAAFQLAGSPLAGGVGLAGPRPGAVGGEGQGEGSGSGDAAGSGWETTGAGGAGVADPAWWDRGELRRVSRRLRQRWVELGPSAFVARFGRELRAVSDGRSRIRLAQAADLAQRFGSEGGGRPGELATLLERALAESPRRAGVRVMTIHRAKGLEFDVVVLPALERPLLRSPGAPVYLLRRSPLAPVEAVHRAAPAGLRRLVPELEEGHRQESARRLRDDLSALYVALTRARHALHLWLEPAAPPGRSAPPSFAAILRETLGARTGGPAGARGGTAHSSEGALHRSGDLGAVAAAIGGAKAAARAPDQALLPRVTAAASRPAGLRPALGLEDLTRPPGVRGEELLGTAIGAEEAPGDDWEGIDAFLSAGATVERSDRELERARAWLLESARGLERSERRRRFCAAVGELVVAGELPRVWTAGGAGTEPRVLVGVDTAGRQGAASGAALRGGEAGLQGGHDETRAGLERARLAVARGLGLPEGAVAILSRGWATLLVAPV